ncbi:MAG TPA: tetratricopeptide repeat protein [Candidatus Limnocylindrales bacterium]|nr:tetratricopeptide repeat protein [Candidatus Limnocylindrales bacterium]
MRSASRGSGRARSLAALLLAAAIGAAGAAAVSAVPAAFADPDPDALSPAKTLDKKAAAAQDEETPTDPNAVASVAEARRLADAKRFGDAARTLRAVLAANPQNLDARSLLARVLAWDRKYAESIAEYQRILREKPDDDFDRAGYARVLAWSGRANESVAQFRRASRSDSRDLEARVGYARALSWAGDLPGATMEYERILTVNPKYGDAWLGLATVARWRGAATASDRFVERAAANGADTAGVREERDAVRRATAPSIGLGWTTAHERQYVDGAPDFIIESTGPSAHARATIARSADVTVRATRLSQFERTVGPVAGTTLSYDLDMTVLRADVALLRHYPVQLAAGLETRTLAAGSPNVLYPLAGDDHFFGWNARAWWYAGRITPGAGARREYFPLKSTSGPPRILSGSQTSVEADLGWQWCGRGSASAGLSQGTYSDDNQRSTVRAGAAYRVHMKHPSTTVDYAVSHTGFDFASASYFTPLESVRHAAGIAVSGESERASLEYGARYQIALVLSSNFEDILTNTWSGYLNLTAHDSFPLGIEGSYSRDNNAYETWYLGFSAAARW